MWLKINRRSAYTVKEGGVAFALCTECVISNA